MHYFMLAMYFSTLNHYLNILNIDTSEMGYCKLGKHPRVVGLEGGGSTTGPDSARKPRTPPNNL